MEKIRGFDFWHEFARNVIAGDQFTRHHSARNLIALPPTWVNFTRDDITSSTVLILNKESPKSGL